MYKLIIGIVFFLCFQSASKAQCSCYSVEGLEIVGQDSMLLQISNTCDNNVYLNLYVISTEAPFDTLGRQEIWSAFILPFDEIIDNILSTTLTTVPVLGTYKVSITNGTLICDSLSFSPTLSIFQHDDTGNVKVFPNPSNGDFFIDLGFICKSVKLTVFDVRGKAIQSNVFEESQELNLQIEEPLGLYFLKIKSEKVNTVIKWIKE